MEDPKHSYKVRLVSFWQEYVLSLTNTLVKVYAADPSLVVSGNVEQQQKAIFDRADEATKALMERVKNGFFD